MKLVQPGGEFEWAQEPWGPALRCVPLFRIAPHLFTTRHLALAGIHEEDGTGWAQLATSAGVKANALVRMRQVHGVRVFEASHARPQPVSYDEWPEADIAIGNDPSVALTVRAADCVPLLLADSRTGAVGAVHAGWRGTAAGAAAAAVAALVRSFGSVPRDIVAAVGPSIGPCCYAVGGELRPRFAAHPDSAQWFLQDGGLRLDLWRATRDQLQRAGLEPGRIHVSGLCTATHPELFHSYRRDGPAAGRLAAAIRRT